MELPRWWRETDREQNKYVKRRVPLVMVKCRRENKAEKASGFFREAEGFAVFKEHEQGRLWRQVMLRRNPKEVKGRVMSSRGGWTEPQVPELEAAWGVGRSQEPRVAGAEPPGQSRRR